MASLNDHVIFTVDPAETIMWVPLGGDVICSKQQNMGLNMVWLVIFCCMYTAESNRQEKSQHFYTMHRR